MKPDGFEYYEYILFYVDDVLFLSHDPKKSLEAIQNKSNPKDDKIAKPEVYLEAGLEKMTNDNGTEFWSMSSEEYLQSRNKECGG